MSTIAYGALTLTDVAVLEKVMATFKGGGMAFVEIGVHTGATARGIQEYCNREGIDLWYTGIDNLTLHHALDVPFVGAQLIIGQSAEVFHVCPDERNAIFIDGAHTRNDVILDTCNYSGKVKVGGFLIFHDTSPEVQHTMREAYGPDIPQFYNAVNEALDLIHWPWPGWELWAEDWERGSAYGGMRVYRRTQG